MRSSIKNEEQYEALREKGYSKSKAARIVNTPDSGKKGGEASPYEERTKKELYEQAKKVGIDGRSTMTKEELIEALRED
ncbi:MAG: Rho termination factor N-terminal domain-containing protein [Bacteroidota bacterium]